MAMRRISGDLELGVKYMQTQKCNYLHPNASCIMQTEIILIPEAYITYLKGANMQHITTQPRISAITHQSVFKKQTFVFALAALGGLTILAGMVSLVSAIILLSNAATPSLASTLLTDAGMDIVTGLLMVTGSRAFAKGKFLAVWFCGGSLLLDSFYSLIKGYPLHYIFIGLGCLFIWQMLKFRTEWETLQ